MKIFISILLCLFAFQICLSQTYLNNKSKYRFAQGAMGVDIQYVPQNGISSSINNNQPHQFNYGGFFVPKIVIGGLHFWGHADIAFNFPVGVIGKKKDSIEINYNDLDFMSFKYYPWALAF